MGKIMVSKWLVIDAIMNDKDITDEQSVIAVKAYLNEDGYEVEKTPEELAIEMYRKFSLDKKQSVFEQGWDKGCVRAMEWMNKNFNLGINFQDK